MYKYMKLIKYYLLDHIVFLLGSTNELKLLAYQDNSNRDSKKSTERPNDGRYSCTITSNFFENNSDSNTLTCKIECVNDETLEIKEELIEDQETTPDNRLKLYESKFCSIYMNEDNTFAAKNKVRSPKKQCIQKLKLVKKYECKKCARPYKHGKSLAHHLKYECHATPRFKCNFCGNQFKRNCNMIRHVHRVHLKTNLQTSKMIHNCDKCSRTFRSSATLDRHKRVDHAGIKPVFNCDFCGYNNKRKAYLSKHITSKHLNK
ncbi:zinc finger protein 566-like [Belonocnema kinseyi]|uniref:zinc finger protein 566-like n=1 Tax=Belonocnema kinseyi TaxID=2817044 RepID=UPI00143D1085|nr:zinc finger protein 566-like [Belonocnema kinseyi]